MAMTDWQMNKQLEAKFKTSLDSVWGLIMRNVKKLDNLDDIHKFLQTLPNFKSFQELANTMATKMVTMADEFEAKTWRGAAKELSRSRDIIEGLRHVINHTNAGIVARQKIVENAHLIKTLPLNVAQDVTKFVASETFKGLRSSEIAKVLHEKIKGYSQARASLIARTESSKTMTALTEARSKDVGCEWYIWRTANDGLRVRPSHRLMKDVVINYNHPPAPEELNGQKSEGSYNAGNIYNCRCFPRPLISLETISWPTKVYYNGSIVSMSKTDFERISGMGNKVVVPPKMPKPAPKPKPAPQPIPVIPKATSFIPSQYVLVKRQDLESHASQFWNALTREEERATEQYIRTSNSFRMNEYIYDGSYTKEMAKQKGPTNLKVDNSKEIARLESEVQALTTKKRNTGANEHALRDTIRAEMHVLQGQINALKLTNNPGGVSGKLSDVAKEIEDFSAVVKKDTIPKDMKVVRNIGNNAFGDILKKIGGDSFKQQIQKMSSKIDIVDECNKRVGAQYTNESFISTSFDAGANVFKNKPVQLKFYVDEGTTGLVTRNWGESEIVFDKGTKVEVIKFELSGSQIVMCARILKE